MVKNKTQIVNGHKIGDFVNAIHEKYNDSQGHEYMTRADHLFE
jgi:hypothetical protein